MKFEDGNTAFRLDNGFFSEDNNIRGKRYRTICCALGTLSLNNSNTVEEIRKIIEILKEENKTEAQMLYRNGHERAYIVMTLPEETELEKNLEDCGFEHISTIHRRNYAPEDSLLKMWLISW